MDSSRGFRIIPFIQLDWAGNTRSEIRRYAGMNAIEDFRIRVGVEAVYRFSGCSAALSPGGPRKRSPFRGACPLPPSLESPAMLKMIFLLARRMFIRLLLVLLPLGLFMFLAQAIPLSPLQSLLVLVPVIAFEVWLVIRHLLPSWGSW